MIEQHDGVNLGAPQHVEEFFLGVRLPAQGAIVYPINVAQKITMNRMRALVRRDETAGEILGLLNRAVAADEEAVRPGSTPPPAHGWVGRAAR